LPGYSISEFPVKIFSNHQKENFMKKKKIIVLAKPVDIKKIADTMACCKAGPLPVKAEE